MRTGGICIWAEVQPSTSRNLSGMCHTNTHIHTETYIHTNTHIHTRTHATTHTNEYTPIHTDTQTHTYATGLPMDSVAQGAGALSPFGCRAAAIRTRPLRRRQGTPQRRLAGRPLVGTRSGEREPHLKKNTQKRHTKQVTLKKCAL